MDGAAISALRAEISFLEGETAFDGWAVQCGGKIGLVVMTSWRVVYVDFDSPWRDALLDVIRSEEGDDAGTEAEENTAPLKSLGISSWLDGDVSHVLVKVSTN